MDKKTAEKILEASGNCSRETHESILRIKEECDEETFKIYRSHGGRIMGYLFTEIIAPIQSEHLDLAPPDFKPMELVEEPKLRLTKQTQDDLLALLTRLYEQIETMADYMRENCEKREAIVYRGRINEVLVYVAEAMARVLAAHVEMK